MGTERPPCSCTRLRGPVTVTDHRVPRPHSASKRGAGKADRLGVAHHSIAGRDWLLLPGGQFPFHLENLLRGFENRIGVERNAVDTALH